MKSLVLPALLASALLAGCASEAPAIRQDHGYVLEWIGERPLIDSSHLSMTLGADGRAYGNAGCNHWFAAYRLEGDAISFGPVGRTRKLCAPALMEQEQRFLQALPTVERWDISPIQQLRLWPTEGKPLRFWPEEN
jgi:heat shock protein HslJ